MSSDRIKQLKAFVEMDPSDSFSKFALALEYLKTSQTIEAHKLFVDIVENDPNYVGVYYHLGRLYEVLDQPTKAMDIYKKGIDIAVTTNDHHAASELRQVLDDLEYSMDN